MQFAGAKQTGKQCEQIPRPNGVHIQGLQGAWFSVGQATVPLFLIFADFLITGIIPTD